MFVFQLLNFLPDVFSGVGFKHGALGLGYNLTLVKALVYVVYSDARFGITCRFYGFVHLIAIHALAAIFG